MEKRDKRNRNKKKNRNGRGQKEGMRKIFTMDMKIGKAIKIENQALFRKREREGQGATVYE